MMKWYRWFFNSSTNHWSQYFYGGFGLATIAPNGLSMVANNWSTNEMVKIHRYGLGPELNIYAAPNISGFRYCHPL